MPEDNVKRKLTAILCADVKGYSRLMGEDEIGTFHTLSVYNGNDITDPYNHLIG